MRREEFDHIRADVHTAILEAQQHDPTVTLEILWELFDQVGAVATGECNGCGTTYATYEGPQRECATHGESVCWATCVMQGIQLRAISKTPYGEPRDDTPPEDHRD